MKFDTAAMERAARRFRGDMWRAVPEDAVLESGIEIQSFGPVQATAFGDLPDAHSVNQIQGAAEPGAVEDGHLVEAIEWMRSREVAYCVPTASSRPGTEQAEHWLGGHGYESGASWAKLVHDPSAPILPEDPGVMIYELGEDEADGEGMSMIAAEVLGLSITAETLFFDLPHQDQWRCYTVAVPARQEGIVATGSMLLDGGVALLGLDATLESARGLGCQQALLRRRLIDAAAARCHTIFAEFSECDPRSAAVARHNLLRAGFREAYRSRNWQRPALRSATSLA
jgi:hypothetical protein